MTEDKNLKKGVFFLCGLELEQRNIAINFIKNKMEMLCRLGSGLADAQITGVVNKFVVNLFVL